MDGEQRAALLEEYKLSYNFGMSFSSMRITAFSVAVAIIGAEASFATTIHEFHGIVVASILLMATAAISTNIVIALNRGTFLFMVHLRGIEGRLGIAGFPTTYLKYVKNQHTNTGIFAFWLAALLLDIAAFGCVAVLIWWSPEGPQAKGHTWLAIGTSLVGAGLLTWALCSLLWHRPTTYLDELEAGFENAQDEALAEVGIGPRSDPNAGAGI